MTPHDTKAPSAERIRVLVVDDHALFRRGLILVLESEDDIEVVGEGADGDEALERALEATPDVVLMDLDLPRMGGVECTRHIKTRLPHVNVVVLTVDYGRLPYVALGLTCSFGLYGLVKKAVGAPAMEGLLVETALLCVPAVAFLGWLTARGEATDRIVGLEIGADDYIAKPVDLRELLARIRAGLRRLRSAPAEPAAGEPAGATMMAIGACKLDLDAHRLYDADGQEVPITSMEFDLLKAFVEHPNRVLSRDQLLDLAHNKDWEPFDRSIDVRVTRLRSKIEPDPSNPIYIKTIWGKGYMFCPDGNG